MKVQWYIKRPPYHPFRPQTNGTVKGVTSVIAFPFPMSRTVSAQTTYQGPYQTGASGWAEVNRAYEHRDKFEAIMHMMTVAMELKNNGCPIFKGEDFVVDFVVAACF